MQMWCAYFRYAFDRGVADKLSVDNFIPGKMDDLGIGYKTLSGINPSIIHASVSGKIARTTRWRKN
jgi:crotonobetainyl-CoA:carnitine CoA-transferase CaiB-like acyl-CoA transferase